MGILSFGRTIRTSQRLANILSILIRHGFGHLVVSLRLERFVPFRQKVAGRVPRRAVAQEDLSTIANRAASALEDLGPTFVKLGQSLAARPDLLPREFQMAFRRLQDRVRPFPFDQVRQIVQTELGAPIEEIYQTFDENPVASGSIAQVHHATTVEGVDVVVKVKRPGIDRIVINDIQLLRVLADLAERHVPEYRVFRPAMLVDEFARTIRQELDFVNEAAVISRFQSTFEGDDRVEFPDIFWDLSSHGVLTLQRLQGINIRPDTDFAQTGLDRPALARNLLDIFFRQFFETGIFHADPHAGNLLAQPPAKWGIVDFGQVGRVDADTRSRLGMCLVATAQRDFDLAMDIFEDLVGLPDDADREQIRGELAALVDKYYGTPIGRINIASIFEEVVTLAREHRVVLPRNFILLGKSLAAIGGMALTLDPDCAPAEVIRPKLNRLLLERISPSQVMRNLGTTGYHLVAFLRQAPRMFRRLIRNMTRGDFRLIFKHEGLDNLIYELDRSSNRIAFSVVTAAIILGSSMLINARIHPYVPGTEMSLLGLLGFVIAAISGVWLIISIFRSGRL